MKATTFVLLAGVLILGVCGSSGGGDDDVKPINLDKLNTKADEDDPFVSADNFSLYYASKKSGTFGIFVSKRSSGTAAWRAGKPLLVSKDFDQRSPFQFKKDLYFASNEIPDEKLANLRNFDIYRKIGGQAPIPLLGEGISERTDELRPWITPSGKEFYFSRKTEDGWMLFVAKGPTPGPISKAKAVGFAKGFHNATLSRDGLTMYVQGLSKEGSWALFRSKRAKLGGKWSEPMPLPGLSHPDSTLGDMSPCLSPDGSRLYFSSDRPGGKGGLDIWYVLTSQVK